MTVAESARLAGVISAARIALVSRSIAFSAPIFRNECGARYVLPSFIFMMRASPSVFSSVESTPTVLPFSSSCSSTCFSTNAKTSFIHLQRQPVADLRETGVIGRRLVQRELQKDLQ